MTSLNISLPEALREFIDEQVATGGYGTASEYIQELLRRAQKEQEEQERLESLLLKALDSPAREMTPQEWDDIRREALERLGREDPALAFLMMTNIARHQSQRLRHAAAAWHRAAA